TTAAKDRIGKMLNGQFFRDSEQFERTPPEIRSKLERITAPLMKVQAKPEWDLIPEVQSAVDLIEYARAHGIRNLRDATAQNSMFSGAPEFSPHTVALAQAILRENPNSLAQLFRDYVAGSQESMFEKRTPEDVFNQVFGGEEPPAPPAPR